MQSIWGQRACVSLGALGMTVVSVWSDSCLQAQGQRRLGWVEGGGLPRLRVVGFIKYSNETPLSLFNLLNK